MSANFDFSFGVLKALEGGYANDPSDRGGETYFGIARKFWPSWEGWKLIDALKQKGTPLKKGEFSDSPAMFLAVKGFYRDNFWIPLWDNLPQVTAKKMFEAGVVHGLKTAIIIAQKCVGVLADGEWGPKTQQAVLDTKDFLSKFAQVRVDFVTKICEVNPSQKKFLAGWINRIESV